MGWSETTHAMNALRFEFACISVDAWLICGDSYRLSNSHFMLHAETNNYTFDDYSFLLISFVAMLTIINFIAGLTQIIREHGYVNVHYLMCIIFIRVKLL